MTHPVQEQLLADVQEHVRRVSEYTDDLAARALELTDPSMWTTLRLGVREPQPLERGAVMDYEYGQLVLASPLPWVYCAIPPGWYDQARTS